MPDDIRLSPPSQSVRIAYAHPPPTVEEPDRREWGMFEPVLARSQEGRAPPNEGALDDVQHGLQLREERSPAPGVIDQKMDHARGKCRVPKLLDTERGALPRSGVLKVAEEQVGLDLSCRRLDASFWGLPP